MRKNGQVKNQLFQIICNKLAIEGHQAHKVLPVNEFNMHKMFNSVTFFAAVPDHYFSTKPPILGLIDNFKTWDC